MWGRLGLGPPPPSLSVLEEDGGGGGGSLGWGAEEEEGGMRVEADGARPLSPPPRRFWIRRHSWQIRTWLQPREGIVTATATAAPGAR